jgi:hypothetical protein
MRSRSPRREAPVHSSARIWRLGEPRIVALKRERADRGRAPRPLIAAAQQIERGAELHVSVVVGVQLPAGRYHFRERPEVEREQIAGRDEPDGGEVGAHRRA